MNSTRLSQRFGAKQSVFPARCVLAMFALLLIELTSCIKLAQAQLNPSRQLAASQRKPPVTGRPDDRVPAGTRGPGTCQETDTPFTPLLPPPAPQSGFSGFTLTGYPTVWFYIPYRADQISFGKFLLEDQEGNLVYQTSFKLAQTPGFVSVSLPTTVKPLEKNKPYYWTFSLACTSQDVDEIPRVWHSGTIERVDNSVLEAQLKTATFEERLNLYIKNNIWYDASTDLVKIHSFSKAWRDLLRAMNLEQLVQAPISSLVVPSENH